MEGLGPVEHSRLAYFGIEEQAGRERNCTFGTGGLAQPALDAVALEELEQRLVHAVHEGRFGTRSDARHAHRALAAVDADLAEGRPRRQRDDLGGPRRMTRQVLDGEFDRGALVVAEEEGGRRG